MDLFDRRRRTPCLFDLGRVGGDADNVGAKFLHKVAHRATLNIGIKDHHLIAPAFAHCAEISQPQMRSRARVNGQAELGIDQQDTQ